MQETTSATCLFVIKSDELIALNYLPASHPVPSEIEWIDRGTDRVLSQTRLEQLLRTYHRSNPSPGILELRECAGVRAAFTNEEQRHEFARLFHAAREQELSDKGRFVTAIFASIDDAEEAAAGLVREGVAEDAIAMLWRANRFMDSNFVAPEGHKRRRVLAGVTAGGVAAAALGSAILIVPGIGAVAVAGTAIASAYSAVATASGIIGATGAAIATMLSDHDVDEVAANHLEEQLRKGKIFVSVDVEVCGKPKEFVGELLETSGGRRV